jgi:hypothetical protein
MSNKFTTNYAVLIYHWQPHKPLFRKIRPSIIYELVYRGETRELMTHKYRGSQQSSREIKPKFIDSTHGDPKNIYKP